MVATRKVLALSVGAEVRDGPPERLGDFRIVRELAAGGMGVVYEAVQEPFGRAGGRQDDQTRTAGRSPRRSTPAFSASRRCWPGCTTPTSSRSTRPAGRGTSSTTPCPTSPGRRSAT